MNFLHVTTLLALVACSCSSVQAQKQALGQPTTKPATAAAESETLTGAEIVKVYPRDKRILLKHGPISNLGMSAMTMEFGVNNTNMLNSLKPGDKVKFTAEMVKEDYVVTFIELAR